MDKPVKCKACGSDWDLETIKEPNETLCAWCRTMLKRAISGERV